MKQTFVPTFVARSNAFPRKGRVTTPCHDAKKDGHESFQPVSDRLPPLSWNYPSNWIAKGNLVRIRPRPPTRMTVPTRLWPIGIEKLHALLSTPSSAILYFHAASFPSPSPLRGMVSRIWSDGTRFSLPFATSCSWHVRNFLSKKKFRLRVFPPRE